MSQSSTSTQKRTRQAIRYVRVSSDDQVKGYSLADQADLIEKYARGRGVRIVATFSDDFSAKTREDDGESFNRPGFNQMLAWIKANPGAADLLLFKDWSRFSRDATDGMVMIRHLRKRLGVEPQAIEQPVDYDVPEQRPMLMFYLGMPEGDNLRRSLNIVRGVRRAKREGRWIEAAPTGYRKRYDDEGKVYIEPDPVTAPFVQEAFRLVATGQHPSDAVRKVLAPKARRAGAGWFASRYRFGQMLRNRAYVGEVFVKAWKDEPEEWVQGRHEPLVDRALFEAVQRVLSGKKPGTKPGAKQVFREELPLRGHLLHPETWERLTGSGSRSRSGALHFYYHTQNNRVADRKSPPFRVRADIAHDAFAVYLGEVKVAPEVADAFGLVLEDALSDHNRDSLAEVGRLEREREALRAKLFRAEEAYVEDKIGADTYHRLSAAYRAELGGIEARLSELTVAPSTFAEHLRYGLSLMSRLDRAWAALDAPGRHALVGSIWPAGLVFADGAYRTTPKSALLWLLGGKNTSTYGQQKTGHPAFLLPNVPFSGGAGS